MSSGVKRKRAGDDTGVANTARVPEILKKNAYDARLFFLNTHGASLQVPDDVKKAGAKLKLKKGYGTDADGKPNLRTRPATGATIPGLGALQAVKLLKGPGGAEAAAAAGPQGPSDIAKVLPAPSGDGQLVVVGDKDKAAEAKKQQERDARRAAALTVLPMSGKELKAMHDKAVPKPKWHAPWKLHRVISGHLGWVRSIAVDHSNEWFVTSGNDRSIKIWDLASGTLKLTMTHHIHAVRAMAISSRSPYLFTASEDKTVLCWDLETNKVVRSYHGHLSGVYSLATYDPLDLVISGGRDASVRVWDVRTKSEVHCLTGHAGAVNALETMPEPTIVSGSQDNQVRIWDIAEGRCVSTLTHHKKGVRAVTMHPTEYTFATASADNIKKWKCPRGEFLDNFSGHNTIVNSLSINNDNVMASGGNDGSIKFWDWKTGYNFQTMNSVAQSGSLECEAGIFASTFDHSGSRLITGEADKTIKIWKEDETATEESHPIEWNPEKRRHF